MFGDLGAAIQEFQSTLSVRRATSSLATKSPSWLFQSTLSVRRATHFVSTVCILRMISIHALREESDHVQFHRCRRAQYFNPRSP